MISFTDLKLAEPLLRALAADGYDSPTPIQQQAIPPLLAGRDLLGIAQTGTGKTAAFALPLLQTLAAASRRPAPRTCRALILAPTRELALQIAESFTRYGRFLALRTTCVFGGVNERPQIRALHPGVDILVATPGRLLDLIGQRAVSLGSLEAFVLDEADRMLDMGFIHDVRRIVGLLPAERQTALLSATMPGDIAVLARDLLRAPVKVEVTPPATTVARVDQKVLFVETARKRDLLIHLLQDRTMRRALVFTRTKNAANRVADSLDRAGIAAAAIHGNKSQGARQKALAQFRDGRMRVLVATDIAARGIDIDGISHVFNFDLPNEPESYVHRIGRTARAGAEGAALAFCDAGELGYLRDIERTTRQAIPVLSAHPWHHAGIADGTVTAPPPASLQGQRHRTGAARRGAHPGHGHGPKKGGRDGRARSDAPQRNGGSAHHGTRRQANGPSADRQPPKPPHRQRSDERAAQPLHQTQGPRQQAGSHEPRQHQGKRQQARPAARAHDTRSGRAQPMSWMQALGRPR